VYGLCMATKTISIDLVAYDRLSKAKLNARDSFSQVIRRAQWQQESKTCAGVLNSLRSLPESDEGILHYLESAQQQDSPPDNPWE